MIFDDTHIVIRERGFAEVMDLALKVLRDHLGPIVLAGLGGIVPWALLDGFLLNRLVSGSELWDQSPVYVWWMLMLIAVQAPLATAPITLYLGQATFNHQIEPSRILRDYWRSLPQMLWQMVIRGVLALTFVGLALPFGFRPYQAELILLERNPMFGGKQKRITTTKRSRNLHRHSGGDLFGHWLASLAAGALMVVALMGGLDAAASQLAGYDLTQGQHLLYVFPACQWTTFAFFTVVRFLAYLDLRIRREGWEVELKLRSEAARLARGLA